MLFVSGYAESTLLRQGVFDFRCFLQEPVTLKVMANKVTEILTFEVEADAGTSAS